MYCYTYANEFACILNELQLWSHISSDHPVFLKTVASLAKIMLPNNILKQLDETHHLFHHLYKHVVHLKKKDANHSRLDHYELAEVKKAIDDFILYNAQAISYYPDLLEYGQDNPVWLELVKHIINEQSFMMDLFDDLRLQL